MIHSLRKRHFHMILGLCLVVPLVFFLAMTHREAIPTVPTFPQELNPVPQAIQPKWETTATQNGVAMQLATAAQDGAWVLQVQPEDALAYPDVLVYLTLQPDKPLLEQAVLLGGMAGAERRQFELPDDFIAKESQLRFYSLAHRQMLLIHDLPALATTP